MRVILFGASDMLVAALSHLRVIGSDALAVCGPRHLEEKLKDGRTLRTTLAAMGADVLSVEDVNCDDRVLEAIRLGTVGFSIGAPWIFKRALISRFEGRLYNLHNAPLPVDRGGGGFSWRILRGDKRGTCLIHQVDERTDTGPIVERDDFTYPDDCRIPAHYIAYTSARAVPMIERFLTRAAIPGNAPIEVIPQDEETSTYWPRLNTKDQGWIDWSWSARDIEQFICAFDDPYMGATTMLNGIWTQVKGVSVVEEGPFHPFMAGVIYRKSKDAVFVACRDNALRIEHVITNGSDPLRVGDRFYSPIHFTDAAKQMRVRYNANGKT